MNGHCCGNCGWWQGLEDPDCQEAECRAKAPCMIPDENAWVQDHQHGANSPIYYRTAWPITKRDQLKCGAHEFKGHVECPIVMNPVPLPEGVAEAVAKVNHETKMDLALKQLDEEWREANGSYMGDDTRRMFRRALERVVTQQ